jgi:PAS domain S-box-containing protein
MAGPSRDVQTIQRLSKAVRNHPDGISISRLSRETGINRNSVAKYLEIMLAAGQVEMKTVGAAKVFYYSRKVPIANIADNFPEIIIAVDTAGKILLANESCNAFFGLAPDELLAVPLTEEQLPGMPAQFFRGVQAGLAGERIDEEFVVGRNGDEAYLRGKFIPSMLEPGKDGLIIFLEDITGERRSKMLLQESENKFRTLFNSSGAMFLVHEISRDGESGPFIEVNTYACDLLGFSRDEFRSMTVTDLLRAPSRITEGSQALDQLHRGECYVTERDIFDKNGRKIPVEIHSHLIDFQGRNVVLSILLDRTYQMKYEEKIHDNLKNLEFLSQMALSLLDLPDDENPYEFVADHLAGIIPGAIVVIDAVDLGSEEWQNKAARGMENYAPLLKKFLGINPQRGYTPSTDRKAAVLRSGKLLHFSKQSFLEFVDCEERKAFIEILADYGYDEFYKMALLRNDSLEGIVVIAIPRGSSLEHPELVEAFLNQAAVALGKYRAEANVRRANETLMQKLVEHERQILKFQEILNTSAIESRENEKSLHGQMELAQRCLELMNIALVTVQESGTITGVNASACELLETPSSELIGRNWFDDFLSGMADVQARKVHQKIAQNSRYSGILKKPVKCGRSGDREMVWMVRESWKVPHGGRRILWIGEEMPGDRVLELSRLT